MLKVTVELIPFGDTTRSKILHEIDIANDGTGNALLGNYKIREHPDGKWKEGFIKNYNRSRPALDLVHKVIDKLGYVYGS